MNQTINKLIGDISCKCLINNISFKLENKHLVDMDDLPCSGYFDEENLVVATKKSNNMEWVTTLLHESCHMDQFLTGSSFYISDSVGLEIVEDWINNKNINDYKLLKGFYNTIQLEIDCEKRTLRKIKKYKLPVKEKRYIQEANAYLFAYVYTLVTKKWYKAPYEKIDIVKYMPTKFLKVEEYFTKFNNYRKYYK